MFTLHKFGLKFTFLLFPSNPIEMYWKGVKNHIFAVYSEGCENFVFIFKFAPCNMKLHPPAKFQACSTYQFRNKVRTDKQTNIAF